MIFSFLNGRTFLVFLLPLTLGSLTVFSFQPFNHNYINFFIIPALFLVTTYVKKKSKSTYRKKPYLLNLSSKNKLNLLIIFFSKPIFITTTLFGSKKFLSKL